jgi:glutaredoxin
MKSHHMTEAHERRIMHMLNAKGIKYQVILVDFEKEKQAEMKKVSGETTLPQLHINGRYFGDYTRVQELEDIGKLDKIFTENGVALPLTVEKQKKTQEATTQLSGKTKVHQKSGDMEVFATEKFIKVIWPEAPSRFPSHVSPIWVLYMDSEPVYCGQGTDYLIVSTGEGPHLIELRAMDEDGQALTSLGIDCFGKVQLAPSGLETARVGRLLAPASARMPSTARTSRKSSRPEKSARKSSRKSSREEKSARKSSRAEKSARSSKKHNTLPVPEQKQGTVV